METECDATLFRVAIVDALKAMHPSLSVSILSRMEEDDLLLHHVAVCLETPEFLAALLPELSAQSGRDSKSPDPAQETKELPSNAEIIQNAISAAKRFLKSGLALSPIDVREQRLTVCKSCEHCVTPPRQRLAFKLTETAGLKGPVCRLCGCSIHAKTMVATERCPDSSGGRYGRWSA